MYAHLMMSWTPVALMFLLFFSFFRLRPRSTLFPYTTLFRSKASRWTALGSAYLVPGYGDERMTFFLAEELSPTEERHALIDRKSTRLNSSHSQISYAVFCLKKKKADPDDTLMIQVS